MAEWLNKFNLNISTVGWVFFWGMGGLMHGIKTAQLDFVLKMQEGLCARGGVFAGHYSSSIFQWAKTISGVHQPLYLLCWYHHAWYRRHITGDVIN